MPGDVPAKEKNLQEMQNLLAEENLRLVHWVLKRFTGRGYDMEELFQVGSVGLVKAARRFEPGRGTAFSTYAVPMIIGEIRRFLRDDGMIHINRKVMGDAQKVAAVRERLKKTENREPTVEELCEVLGLAREDILLAIGSMYPVDSIFSPVSGGQDDRTGSVRTVEELLADPREAQEGAVDRLALRQLLAGLDETSRALMTLRYQKGLTQQQTAGMLGMNQVAVSRLEKKILLRFRGML